MAAPDKGKFVVVKWERVGDKTIDDKSLATFVSAQSSEKPLIKIREKKQAALLQFDKDQDAGFLRAQWTDDKYWKITELKLVHESHSLRVYGLPENSQRKHVNNFFTNETMIDKLKFPSVDVDVKYFKPALDLCVVHLNDSKEVEEACKRQKKFKKFTGKSELKLEPFYDDIHGIQTEINVAPLPIDIGESTTLFYLREFQNEEIEDELKENHCTTIKFPGNNGPIVLTFACIHDEHKVERGKKWENEMKRFIKEKIDKVEKYQVTYEESIWPSVKNALQEYTGSNVWVDEDEKKYTVQLVGIKDEQEMIKLREALSKIKPPKVKEQLKIQLKEHQLPKVQAFHDLGLKETIDDVEVGIDFENITINLLGDKEVIGAAEMDVYAVLGSIKEHRFEFPSKAHEAILTTPKMKDKIQACIDDLGIRCGFTIDSGKIIIFSTEQTHLYTLEKEIMSLLVSEKVKLKGKVKEKSKFELKIKEGEKKFPSSVNLQYEIEDKSVTISVLSDKDNFQPVSDYLKEHVECLLEREERIPISPHIVAYIQQKGLGKIISDIKHAGLDHTIFHSHPEYQVLTVKGVDQVRKKVIDIVQIHAKKIKAVWKQIEASGIDSYCHGNTHFHNFLKSMLTTHERESEIRLARKSEMKSNNIHCIVVLDSGQAIFVGTGSLAQSNLTPDVVVNATNTELDFSKGLGRDILKAGGSIIERKCSEFLQKQGGQLKEGDIFVSASGRLPCQKLIYVAAPKWQGGQAGEEDTLKKATNAILTAMNDDKDFVLRSVAMPLIGHGQMGFAANRSARIMLEVINANHKSFPNVREIYFYDFNPQTVRIIQSEMQRLFQDRCYHLPVENVVLGKDSIGMSKKIFCLRSGERILPMLGGKLLKVRWGKIAETPARVVVNPTHAAPTPKGKITHALKTAVTAFALDMECKKAFDKVFPKKTIPNGSIVDTYSGGMPCDTIYHMKIADKLDKVTGKQDLEGYIEACLNRASGDAVESIAMPTIGTADCDYNAVTVAEVSIRTVYQYMKKKPSCSLKEVIFVIYETDMSTTAAFEATMEGIFKQRPHRLQSSIEESVDVAEERLAQQGFNPRQTPFSVGTPGPPTQGYYKVKNGVTINMIKGSIELAKADAIVCTSSSFPRLNGAISKAILAAGGTALESELKQAYKGYPGKGAASTKSGKMTNCKRVFYVVIEPYGGADGGKVSTLSHNVKRCLAQADTEGLTSIAMPTFGTGGFKYPDQTAAQQMFKAIQEYFSVNSGSLTHLTIVMFGQATVTNQIFEQEVIKYFQPCPMPTPPKTPSTSSEPSSGSGPQQNPVPVSRVTVQGDTLYVEKCSVELTYGNLQEAKADVILDTTTSFPKLNGVIPQSLLKVAGSALQDECNRLGKREESYIIETDGYNLQCQKVYHYILPTWPKKNGEQTIVYCIERCLHKMKNSGLTSIAVPSIGTGGAKYDATCVARGIYRAVEDFASVHPSVTCHVQLVLFPTAVDINKTFVAEMITREREASGGSQPAAKPKVTFADSKPVKDKGFEEPLTEIPKQKKDFVLLQITSDKTKNVEAAFGEIQKKIKDDTKHILVELKDEDNIDDLQLIETDKPGNRVEDFGPAFNAEVIVDKVKRQINIHGISDTVTECYTKILTHLREHRKAAMNRTVGIHVLQRVEWYYTEDGGAIWVPYPSSFSFLLQEAYETTGTGINEKEFRDSDDKTYVVNFKDMVEHRRTDENTLQKDSKISVMRKDLIDASTTALPVSWDPMPDMDNLKVVVIKSTAQEFKDVQTAFNQTLGRVANIKEIRRIQNKSLYQQYQTKKQQLEAIHKNLGYPIERALWHGCKEDVEPNITGNGFNRSYAGGTFGAVWFGCGVYFATESSYSALDNYSPPDNKGGWKHVYQAKVLTGNTTEVVKGYSDRYPPLIPGSQTDRYNSTCDDMNSPKEFVIYSDMQAYPEYMILFK